MATTKQLNKKPKWKGVGKLFLTVFLGFLSYFNFKLILNIWENYNLGYVFANESEMINFAPKFADLIVLYPIIAEFLLISLTAICFVNMFKKLSSHSKVVLIGRLIKGLIFGLIFGLISGLIGVLIFGLISGLILGSMGGLIFGLINGIIFGLIGGLIFWLDDGLI